MPSSWTWSSAEFAKIDFSEKSVYSIFTVERRASYLDYSDHNFQKKSVFVGLQHRQILKDDILRSHVRENLKT
jgi:hypothetical protein